MAPMLVGFVPHALEVIWVGAVVVEGPREPLHVSDSGFWCRWGPPDDLHLPADGAGDLTVTGRLAGCEAVFSISVCS